MSGSACHGNGLGLHQEEGGEALQQGVKLV